MLAEPILADRDQPPFPRSTRDGFACRASEIAAGAPIKVIGLLKAGESWPGSQPGSERGASLGAQEAIEIMTGAPLPLGADCIVMIEHVERTADVIRLSPGRRIEPGENFIPTGAEARAGATLVAAGTRIGPSQIAAAAAVGASQLRVYPRPKVAIVSTGDELVPLDTQPLPIQIRNSNSYSLAAQVLALGGEPLIQPIAADSEHTLNQSVRAAVTDGCDLLLLSGGVSMGKYDLVEGVLASLGAGFFFTGVRIQPGKPVVFGELASLGRLPFFGLPGNPVSTMVTFALFVAPVLAALCGERGYAHRFAEARVAEPVQPKPGLQRFLPARLTSTAEAATVALVPWQGSGDIAGTAQANCLLVIPEPAPGSSDRLLPGEPVRVLLL
jgi:molybdopterin molybdotransferase